MSPEARKLALLIEYDGRAYHGFQVQDNALTVQGVLERGLNTITGEDNRLSGASRTDTGVHALGQVASFTTWSYHSPETFVAALNYYLPEDVAVRKAWEVSPDFDPRRDALSRWYRYLVLNRTSRSPLARGHALWVREPLDVPAMDCAARELAGTHDLASFSGPLPKLAASTVRHVYRAEVVREGPLVYFDIEANAFLPQQVRRTMGALLAVGKMAMMSESIGDLLRNPARGAAAAVAPAQGLWLIGIAYPEGTVPLQLSREREAALPMLATMTKEWGTT